MSGSNQLVPRYDPSAADASKYEMKLATKGQDPVSNGRYFVVSDELKSALSMPQKEKNEKEEEEEEDPFTEHFFIQKNDRRLDEDPFFDPQVVQKLKQSAKGELVKQMKVSLSKKKRAAKNRKAGRFPVPPKKKNTVEK